MPGTYAPPAVEEPKTRQMVGMRSAERRVSSRKPLPPGTKVSDWYGRSAPPDSVRLMIGSRFCSQISIVRALLRTLYGLSEPPRTVGSLAVITHSTPDTTPTPETTPPPTPTPVPQPPTPTPPRTP